eukprot:6690483-Prymnesium_polylepis.1
MKVKRHPPAPWCSHSARACARRRAACGVARTSTRSLVRRDDPPVLLRAEGLEHRDPDESGGLRRRGVFHLLLQQRREQPGPTAPQLDGGRLERVRLRAAWRGR